MAMRCALNLQMLSSWSSAGWPLWKESQLRCRKKSNAARAVALQAHQVGVSNSSEAVMVYTSRDNPSREQADQIMQRHAREVQAALEAHPSLRVVGHAYPGKDISSGVHSLLGR